MTALDTAQSSAITDHAHVAPPGQPWARCVFALPREHGDGAPSWPCGMAQAAHATAEAPYAPHGTYRCPNCVTRGKATCNHPKAGEVEIP